MVKLKKEPTFIVLNKNYSNAYFEQKLMIQFYSLNDQKSKQF